MGHFLAVSAFKNQTVEVVASSIAAYAGEYGVTCDLNPDSNYNSKTDATIFAPDNGWTIVLWPEYFNIHNIEVCRELSLRMHCIVSTIHVYADDYWTHVLFDQGRLLDRFASMPNCFADDAKAPGLRQRWAGNADVISQALSLSASQISPYLVTIGDTEMGKAFPEDEHELTNFWVFTDFWAKIKIHYPEDMGRYALRLRLDKNFGGKLPIGDEL